MSPDSVSVASSTTSSPDSVSVASSTTLSPDSVSVGFSTTSSPDSVSVASSTTLSPDSVSVGFSTTLSPDSVSVDSSSTSSLDSVSIVKVPSSLSSPSYAKCQSSSDSITTFLANKANVATAVDCRFNSNEKSEHPGYCETSQTTLFPFIVILFEANCVESLIEIFTVSFKAFL